MKCHILYILSYYYTHYFLSLLYSLFFYMIYEINYTKFQILQLLFDYYTNYFNFILYPLSLLRLYYAAYFLSPLLWLLYYYNLTHCAIICIIHCASSTSSRWYDVQDSGRTDHPVHYISRDHDNAHQLTNHILHPSP